MIETHAALTLLADLLDSQKLAVLATLENGQPYTSLMAFAATPDLRRLVLATRRTSRKYTNLVANPQVSLLIDNRQEGLTSTAMAVTVLAEAKEATAAERQELLPLFSARQPQLAEFAAAADCALIVITVERYYLVRRFEDVTEVRLD